MRAKRRTGFSTLAKQPRSFSRRKLAAGMAGRYDVIVVGSGSGGGVVASRLSEDPKIRLLMIEAGPDPGDHVPDAVRYIERGTGVDEYDWNYLDGQTRGAVARGRILGGSSAVNASFAFRGQPEDYDGWAARGAPSWSWEHCLPYFRKLETDREFGGLPYHGNSGPIHIEREPLNEFQSHVRAACLELGHSDVDDLNRPGAVGVGPLPRNLKDGQRQSTLLTYIAAARPRPNLTIQADTLVESLVIRDGRAVGVRLAGGEVVEGGRVVLAAGAYNSPQIVQDVGRQAIPGLFPIGPTLKLRTTPDLAVDDVKFTHVFGEIFSMPGLNGLYLEISNCGSQGVVQAVSRDPRVAPLFDHRYFSNQKDLDRMVGTAKVAFEVAKVIGESVKCDVLLPDAETARDEEALRAHFLAFHATDYHPSGTLRMGSDDDEMAVVDDRCRLRGIENLYVADASVMPTVPRANINLPTMMIGERVAEFVRTDL